MYNPTHIYIPRLSCETHRTLISLYRKRCRSLRWNLSGVTQATFLAVAGVAAALLEAPHRAAAAARQAANLRLLAGVARLVHGNAQRTYHYMLRLDGEHALPHPHLCVHACLRTSRPQTLLCSSLEEFHKRPGPVAASAVQCSWPRRVWIRRPPV